MSFRQYDIDFENLIRPEGLKIKSYKSLYLINSFIIFVVSVGIIGLFSYLISITNEYTGYFLIGIMFVFLIMVYTLVIVLWGFFGIEKICTEDSHFLLTKNIFFQFYKKKIKYLDIKCIEFYEIDFIWSLSDRKAHMGFGKGKVVIKLKDESEYSFGIGLTDDEANLLVDEMNRVLNSIFIDF